MKEQAFAQVKQMLDLKYREGLLQIKGAALVREMMQALGEDQVFHDSIKEVEQELPEASSPNSLLHK